jgi:DNA polymerase-3 subunit delta
VVELDSDAIRSYPARLMYEAAAISMMGGRRAFRINGVTDGQAKVIEDFLGSHRDSKNTLVIFEAGELPGRAALRKLFEGAPHAAAIACYHDSGGDLKAVIQAQLSAAGKSAAPAALSYLEQSLGGDRGATRSEIEKLVLYVGAARQVELEDVMASVGHSAGVEQDDLNYAIAEGDSKAIERQLDLNLAETAPIMILRGLARHFLKLHGAVGRLESGANLQDAMIALNSPLFWRDRPRLEKQCRRWSSRSIAIALQKIGETESQAMRHREIADTLTRRAGLEIAALPRKR